MLKRIASHAAITIGSMYYVFWGIDRVNRSMNFIDNVYTKLLILLLILCCGVMLRSLLVSALRRLGRTRNPAPIYARLGILALNALLCAALLALLLIDWINGNLMIFLNEFVKILVLLLAITAHLNAFQLIARDRALARRRRRR